MVGCWKRLNSGTMMMLIMIMMMLCIAVFLVVIAILVSSRCALAGPLFFKTSLFVLFSFLVEFFCS